MGKLLVPPKLYIDTGHLVNIHRLRSGQGASARFRLAYEFLDECIRVRHFGVILSLAAPLEWVDGKATPESATQIAGVVDSAQLKFLYEGDSFVYLAEVLRECGRQDAALNVPDLPILHPLSGTVSFKPTLGLLAHNVPGYFEQGVVPSSLDGPQSIPTVVPVTSARQYALEAIRYKSQNPNTYKERVAGYNAALLEDMKHASLLSKGTQPFIFDWMKRFLKVDKVLQAFNPGIEPDAILMRTDLKRCPAVSLWFAAREKRIRAGHLPDENDCDDWVFLPIVPYADLVLADRGFCEFVWQADRKLESKVTSDPNQARDILKDWVE